MKSKKQRITDLEDRVRLLEEIASELLERAESTPMGLRTAARKAKLEGIIERAEKAYQRAEKAYQRAGR